MQTPPLTYGSDVIVSVLGSLGIKYFALNPGATLRGLHDSLVHAEQGAPGIILCNHEEIAVAIAHGYAKASGEAMAVGLHNIVGLQHATMAIFNAWMDRVPMLLIGGGGPLDLSRRRPWIDWIHTAYHQGELVRQYVKWETQPFSMSSIVESMLRAYQVATTEPRGPVYICFDAELQEQHLEAPIPVPDPRRYLAYSPPRGDSEAIQYAAKLLAQAERPAIIASDLGRYPGAVEALVRLADRLAAPVIEWVRGGVSFPNRHPLDLTGDPAYALADADVVLSLNVRDIWAMLAKPNEAKRTVEPLIPAGTKVIQVGNDYLPYHSWTAEYGQMVPAEIRIPVNAALVLGDLIAACSAALGDAGSGEMRERRRQKMAERHQRLLKNWQAAARGNDGDPVNLARLAGETWEVLSNRQWMLANGRAGEWARRLWDWNHPKAYLGDSGGAGKGYGLGASIGAALALKDSGIICIDFQGDGDLLYTPGALWTAAHLRLPLLIIVQNNRSYGVDERHQREIGRERNRLVDRSHIGIRMDDPLVDYAGLARSFGVYGLGPVATVGELRRALREAVDHIDGQRGPVLIDAVLA